MSSWWQLTTFEICLVTHFQHFGFFQWCFNLPSLIKLRINNTSDLLVQSWFNISNSRTGLLAYSLVLLNNVVFNAVKSQMLEKLMNMFWEKRSNSFQFRWSKWLEPFVKTLKPHWNLLKSTISPIWLWMRSSVEADQKGLGVVFTPSWFAPQSDPDKYYKFCSKKFFWSIYFMTWPIRNLKHCHNMVDLNKVPVPKTWFSISSCSGNVNES